MTITITIHYDMRKTNSKIHKQIHKFTNKKQIHGLWWILKTVIVDLFSGCNHTCTSSFRDYCSFHTHDFLAH